MADDNILQVGALMDVAALQSGMDAAVGSVESGTAAMSSEFQGLADSTAAADSAMIESMAALTTAVEALTASFAKIPAEAGPAIVETESLLTGFQEKLIGVAEAAEASTIGVGAGFAGLAGILGAGALAGILGNFADKVNQGVLALGNMSLRAGTSISSMAGLQHVANELGISFDTVAMGMTRLERAQVLAIEGGKAQQTAFERIGISVEQLKSQTPEEIFNTVSGAIQRSKSSADAAATSIALLGRGGAALIPVFKQYGDTIGEVIDKLGEETGITQESYENALQFQKASADLEVQLRKLALDVMPYLTKVLHDLAAEFTAFAKGGTVDEISSWAGKIAATFDELGGSMNAAGVQLRDLFTYLPGLGEPAVARHREDAAELQKIWADTAAKVRADLGIAIPQTAEESLASALKAAQTQFPTKGENVPGGEGKGEKASEAKAEAEAILQAQLAGIKAWEAAQKVAFESGKIDATEWEQYQIEATNLAYAAQQSYFNKLKAIFASDPAKESIIAQEQLKFEFTATAKTSEELASSYKKLDEILKEYNKEALLSKELHKEESADLKATDKSVQDYIASLKTLASAQHESTAIDFSAQEESIRRLASEGVISQREAASQLIVVYRQQADSQIAALQDQLSRQQALLDAAEARRTAAEGSGDAARLNEARASYNQQLAALTQTQNEIQAIITRTNNQINSENQKLLASYTQVYTRISGQINAATAQWITGHQTFQKALQGIWNSILTDAITAILRIGERWVLQHVLMAAASKLFHLEDVTAATAAQTAKSAVNVGEATSDAAVAAAGQFAWYSAVSPPIAPAMAAAAYAQGLAWAGLAAFEHGGISEGGLSLLHPKEMVLPPHISTGVQNLISSGGTSVTNNAESSSSTTTHVHVHMGSVQALDAEGVGSVLKRQQREIAKHVQRSIATGHLDVRKIGGGSY